MKLIINRNYGGFYIPKRILKELGYKDCWDGDINWNMRGDLRLIKMVEENPKQFQEECFRPDLCVVEIPKEATDYKILEYDGAESVIYVLNGKIHNARWSS